MGALDRLKRLFSDKEPVKDKPKPRFPFIIRPDDIFIVSYPKSGNTWVRFLIGNYITNNEVHFKNAHLVIPDMHFNPAQIEAVISKPRFIKSHLAYQPEFTRVIYIVRDAREAAVSLYYYLRKMKEIPLELSMSDFLEKNFFNGNTTFGHWDKHVLSWLDHPAKNKVLIVHYEKMIADPEHELKRMVEFCGLPVDDEKIKAAVQQSSFDSMQKDEQEDPDLIAKLGKNSVNTGYGFVRKGEIDSWKTELSSAEQEKFLRLYGSTLKRLGYI